MCLKVLFFFNHLIVAPRVNDSLHIKLLVLNIKCFHALQQSTIKSTMLWFLSTTVVPFNALFAPKYYPPWAMDAYMLRTCIFQEQWCA